VDKNRVILPYDGKDALRFNPYPSLGNKWYSVHWYIQPQDIDSGVMEIERILRESFLLTQQTA
jgi:hypothetical protein